MQNSLKFVKRRILITCFFITLLGSFYAENVSFKLLSAVLLLIAWYLHAASSNDYADRRIDEINLKGNADRPLVARSISNQSLWISHSLAGVAALALSVVFGLRAFLLMVVILLLNYAYSFRPFRLSDRGFVSQLTLPLAYVLLPLSLGYWSGQTTKPYPWLLLAGLYTGFIARLLLKDFRDVKGDKKFGKRTFLLRHGRVMTCKLSGLFASISLLILTRAIDLAMGPTIILIIGHMLVILLLIRLSQTTKIPAQVKLVKVIAKSANGSVIVILSYYLLQMIDASSDFTSNLPFLIGCVWYLLIIKRHKNDIQAQLT